MAAAPRRKEQPGWALVRGPAAAAVSAVLFGGTFNGAVMLSMEAGARIGIPRAAASGCRPDGSSNWSAP